MNKYVRLVTLSSIPFVCYAAASGARAATTDIVDPSAKVEYQGSLGILTKFGDQQLSPYFKNLAAEYEKMHPGVKISLIQENDDSVKDKTKTLVASRSLPDIVFSWSGIWGHNFIRGKRVVDLTPVMNPDSEWGKTFTPAAIGNYTYDGKVYGIPLYLDAKFMGYNKTIFSKLGIDKPKTFEELIQSCDKIKSAGYTPISFGNKESWPSIHYLGQILAYNVPKAVLEQDNNPKTAKFTDPGYIAALDQYKQLLDHCTIGADANGISYQTAKQDMSDEKSTMYYQEILEFDEVAKQGKMKPEDFDFFRLPPPKDAKGDPNALEGAPEGYMISSASNNVPLALDFMKFATNQQNAKVLSDSPYGQPSAVIGGLDPKNMSPSVVAAAKQIQAAPYLIQWMDTINHPRVAATWLSSGQAFVGGSMSAQQVMDAVRKTASSVAE